MNPDSRAVAMEVGIR